MADTSEDTAMQATSLSAAEQCQKTTFWGMDGNPRSSHTVVEAIHSSKRMLACTFAQNERKAPSLHTLAKQEFSTLAEVPPFRIALLHPWQTELSKSERDP